MGTNTRRILAVVALAGMACVSTIAYAKPSGNWRIVFDHVATTKNHRAGCTYRRHAIDVEIRVPAKTTENGVADLLDDTLKEARKGQLSRRRR